MRDNIYNIAQLAQQQSPAGPQLPVTPQAQPRQETYYPGFDPLVIAGLSIARGRPASEAMTEALTMERERQAAQLAQQQQEEMRRKAAEQELLNTRMANLSQNWQQFTDGLDPTDFMTVVSRLQQQGLTPIEAISVARSLAEVPLNAQNIQMQSQDRLMKQMLDQAEAERRRLETEDKRMMEMEDDIRKEHTQASKTFKQVNDSFQRIRAIYKKPNQSGIDDKALVFAHMNMIDPGARVTDQDYFTTESARGMSDNVMMMWTKVMKGDKLTPEQRRQIYDSSIALYQAAKTDQDLIDEEYKDLAQGRNINPEKALRKFRQVEEADLQYQPLNDATSILSARSVNNQRDLRQQALEVLKQRGEL